MRSGVGILLGALLLLALARLPGPASASDGPASPPQSYAAVKRALYGQVFVENRRTLYCNCSFDADRRLDIEACGYESPSGSKRARQVEVEHVVPASWIGQGRPCWRKKICRDAKGRAFKGRRCCLAVDPGFRAAYQDLHNLWPTIGEVNEVRSNHRFGVIEGERRAFGRCDIEIAPNAHLVEPRPETRGDIARINLYMEAIHNIRLSDTQRRLFQAWHREDPPNAEERRRHELIRRLQGRTNPWVGKPAAM